MGKCNFHKICLCLTNFALLVKVHGHITQQNLCFSDELFSIPPKLVGFHRRTNTRIHKA